jgi:hypothetical protein
MWNYYKFWQELVAFFPMIRNAPNRKGVQQFFYCCVCIRFHGEVVTKPLPSNDRGDA